MNRCRMATASANMLIEVLFTLSLFYPVWAKNKEYLLMEEFGLDKTSLGGFDDALSEANNCFVSKRCKVKLLQIVIYLRH